MTSSVRFTEEMLGHVTFGDLSLDTDWDGRVSYTYVGRGQTKSSHGKLVLLYEPLAHHHGDGANFLMDNGEVWWIRARAASLRIAELSRGDNPPHAPPGGWPDD